PPVARLFGPRVFSPLNPHDPSLPATAAIPRPHPRGYMFGTNVGTVPPACDAATVGRHDVTDASPSWTWSAGGARARARGAVRAPPPRPGRRKGPPAPPPPAPEYGLHITNFFGLIGHDGN